MTFLESDLLRLRALEPEDLPLIEEIEGDTSQWLENRISAPCSRKIIREYLDSYRMDPFGEGQLRLAVCLAGEGIGLADLYDISAGNSTAFVAIYILPEFRAKGFASEAVALLERYASEVLGLRMLGAKVAATNEPSLHLFSSAGYRRCGILTRWLRTGHTLTDLLLFQKDLPS